MSQAVPTPFPTLRESGDPYSLGVAAMKKSTELLAQMTPNSLNPEQVTTSTAGSGWVQLPSAPAFRLRSTNISGAALVFAYGTASAANVITYVATGTGSTSPNLELYCVANANEWYVQRFDKSTTTVTLNYLAFFTY
jgi:hypothetical protein